MSNCTIRGCGDVTAPIDEILSYLIVGDQRQALMHANLLLTNIADLLLTVERASDEEEDESATITGAEKIGIDLVRAQKLKDAVIAAIFEIERGRHTQAELILLNALLDWTDRNELIRSATARAVHFMKSKTMRRASSVI